MYKKSIKESPTEPLMIIVELELNIVRVNLIMGKLKVSYILDEVLSKWGKREKNDNNSV